MKLTNRGIHISDARTNNPPKRKPIATGKNAPLSP